MILKFVLLVHVQDAFNTQIIITLTYTVSSTELWEILALKMTVLLITTLLAEDVSLRCQCPLRTGLSLWSLADAALQRDIESQRGEYASFLRRIWQWWWWWWYTPSDWSFPLWTSALSGRKFLTKFGIFFFKRILRSYFLVLEIATWLVV